MDEIRMAVVGLGSRGAGTWFRILQQMAGYRITAICDPIAALHERALAKLTDPDKVKVYTHYEDVLADGNVDALDILLMIGQWGSPCPGPCEADITGPVGAPDGVPESMHGEPGRK